MWQRGPEAIEALYLELGDERYARAADHAYAQRDIIDRRFGQLLGTLAEGGHLDRTTIDTPKLIDEYVDRLLDARKKDESPSESAGEDDIPDAGVQ